MMHHLEAVSVYSVYILCVSVCVWGGGGSYVITAKYCVKRIDNEFTLENIH